MRWPQAVTQSQDPSALLFSMCANPAVLFWWSDRHAPPVLAVSEGPSGNGVAWADRIRRGSREVQPGARATAVAGQDIGPERVRQVGQGAVVEQVTVHRIRHHPPERVRVAGQLASDLGGDGLPVEQAVPVGLAAQRLQVDDELHLHVPGLRLPVDVTGLGRGAQDPGGERVGTARPDEDSVRVVDGGEDDVAVAGRPHRTLGIVARRDGRVADLVGCCASLRPEGVGVGVEGCLDRGDGGGVVDHPEVGHAVLELPGPHRTLLARSPVARRCVGVVVGDGLGDLVPELLRGHPLRLGQCHPLHRGERIRVGAGAGALDELPAVALADLTRGERGEERRERRGEHSRAFDRHARGVRGGACRERELLLHMDLRDQLARGLDTCERDARRALSDAAYASTRSAALR